jgi:hypothetical protein
MLSSLFIDINLSLLRILYVEKHDPNGEYNTKVFNSKIITTDRDRAITASSRPWNNRVTMLILCSGNYFLIFCYIILLVTLPCIVTRCKYSFIYSFFWKFLFCSSSNDVSYDRSLFFTTSQFSNSNIGSSYRFANFEINLVYNSTLIHSFF